LATARLKTSTCCTSFVKPPSKINLGRGASAFADWALVNRAARASRPGGIDPLRKSGSCPSGRNEKPDLYAVASCIKVRPSYLAAKPYDCKGLFRSLGEVSLCVRGAKAHSLGRRCDYFFFFAVFLATFLVAALAVFFAFFAFLAMWSPMRLSLSERAHAVHRHAQR
jgi:hypothetical protein